MTMLSSSPLIVSSNYSPMTAQNLSAVSISTATSSSATITNEHSPASTYSRSQYRRDQHPARDRIFASILDGKASEFSKLYDDCSTTTDDFCPPSPYHMNFVHHHPSDATSMDAQSASHSYSKQQKCRLPTSKKRLIRKKQRSLHAPSVPTLSSSSLLSSYYTTPLTVDCNQSMNAGSGLIMEQCRKLSSFSNYFQPYNTPVAASVSSITDSNINHHLNPRSYQNTTSKLKHKKCSLRSTAPILYDLLSSDDCTSENMDTSKASEAYRCAASTMLLGNADEYLCRSFDFCISPLSASPTTTAPAAMQLATPFPLSPTTDPHHNLRTPFVSYFNNLMQQSFLISSAAAAASAAASSFNLLKIMQPFDAIPDWPIATNFDQPSPSLANCDNTSNNTDNNNNNNNNNNVDKNDDNRSTNNYICKQQQQQFDKNSSATTKTDEESLFHQLMAQQQPEQPFFNNCSTIPSPSSNSLVIVDDDIC